MELQHLNMAFYRSEDWNRLLLVVDDRDVFHETWDQWHEQYLTAKKKLESEGFIVHDVVVDIDELVRFCFQNGMKIDGKARARFVS